MDEAPFNATANRDGSAIGFGFSLLDPRNQGGSTSAQSCTEPEERKTASLRQVVDLPSGHAHKGCYLTGATKEVVRKRVHL